MPRSFAAGVNPEALARAGIATPKVERKSKYGAVKMEYGGHVYDSRLEASVAARLDLLQKAGYVVEWERQQEFELQAGIKYRSDFVVFYRVGLPRVIDAKGVLTAVFKLKRRLFESLYGPLDVITRPEDVPAEGLR